MLSVRGLPLLLLLLLLAGGLPLGAAMENAEAGGAQPRAAWTPLGDITNFRRRPLPSASPGAPSGRVPRDADHLHRRC